jgi:hypothetical protein
VVEYVKHRIQVSLSRDLETMLRLTILWREKESDMGNREEVGKIQAGELFWWGHSMNGMHVRLGMEEG